MRKKKHSPLIAELTLKKVFKKYRPENEEEDALHQRGVRKGCRMQVTSGI